MHLKGWATDLEDILVLTSVFAGTPLDILMVRRKNPLPKPFRPSKGNNLDQLTQPQMREQRQSTHKSQPSNSNQVSTSHIQPEGKDDSAQERNQQSTLRIVEPCVEDGTLANKSTQSLEHQSGDDARGQVESTLYLIQQSQEAANELVGPAHSLVPQNVEDACGSKVPTCGFIHQPGEDAYELVETNHGLAENTTQPTHDSARIIANVDSFADASQRCMDSIYVEQELVPELAQHVKPFPLHGLHLNSKDKRKGNSTPMSSSGQQSIAFNRLGNYLKDMGSPCIVSRASTRSCDPAKVENGPVKLSSGGPRSGCHLDTNNRQHKRLRVSPNEQSPLAIRNVEIVENQGDSHIPLTGQILRVEGSSTTAHSWPPQNSQQQSSISENQSLPQAQMAQFPTQNAGQYGMVADNQVYNQMMENYFLQQQHLISQQQQLLPHLSFQQLLQLQEQQAMQQQLRDVHNHLCSQQRQQVAQLSFQQLLQLQEQQAMQKQLMDIHHHRYSLQQQQLPQLSFQQLLQLQEYQAMQKQLMDVHHHLYSLQQQQLPQLSFQQLLQLQEQQAMQQQHEFCNQSLLPQEQNPMQQQHQQWIISPQIPTWSRAFSQQSLLQNFGSSYSRVEPGQQFAYQVMSPHSASASEIPNPNQQSQGITQSHHAAASGSSVSPHNQL